LYKLAKRLKQLKKNQKAINNQTDTLADQKGDGRLNRKQLMKLRDLSSSQESLVETTSKIQNKLEEEGVVVYDWTIRTIKQDMNDISERLYPKRKLDAFTSRLQKDVVKRISTLIDALNNQREKKKQRRKRGTGQQAGGQMQQPLVPTSAELQMLRQMQAEIYDRTKQLDESIKEQLKDGQAPSPIQESRARRLSIRQMKIKELTEELKEKLTRKRQ
jgi:hypothetical protein